MKNSDLIKRLSEMPNDLPIMFKVSQEIIGHDEFAWVRGECVSVSVEDLYTGDDGEIWDYAQIFDDVNDDPAKYGLSEDIGDWEIEDYLEKYKKETVISVEVHP